MKKRFIVYSLIVLFIMSVGFLVVGRGKHQKMITVKTSVVDMGRIKAYLSTTGRVESQNKKEYYGRQSEVQKVNVKVGDRVKKGDILVTYNTQDLSGTVSQAEIQYNNAILQREDLYNQNTGIKNKINDLDKQIRELEKSSNPTDLSKLESLKQQKNSLSPISNEKLKQADNSVKLAKLSLNSAKENLARNKNTIAAENDGVVTEVNVVEGAMGNAAQAAVVIQDTQNLKVVLSLGKFDAAKVRLGQEVVVNNGNNVYNGRVSFIEPAAKTTISAGGSETALGVEIDILDKSPDLKIDFDVDVDILVGQAQNVIKVPAESVKVEKGNRNLVYVLDGNTVHEKNITVGIQSDKEVEIKEGVNKGEKVILNPSNAIVEGVQASDSTGGILNARGE